MTAIPSPPPPRLPGLARALALLAAGLAGGCARSPLECTELQPGDLAVSELRGKQSEANPNGQWIELHNPGAQPVDLSGAVLRLLRLDGSGERELRVRDLGMLVPAGDYFVLGSFSPESLPAYVDYGFADEYDGDVYPDAILELSACGRLVDRLIYRNLPERGSLAFDGATPLTAESNDDPGRWCVDASAPEAGWPGTPGESNPRCN